MNDQNDFTGLAIHIRHDFMNQCANDALLQTNIRAGCAGDFETDGGDVLGGWWCCQMLAYLGHNALYVLVGLLCFRWLKNEAEEYLSGRALPSRLQLCRAVILLHVFGQPVAA
jgi:hypothetical protein